MRPLIGITASINEQNRATTGMNNVLSVSRAGGVPVVLPVVDDVDTIKVFVEEIDGLILTGGNDVDPFLYGEEPHKDLGTVNPERDFFEMELLRAVLTLDKPVLGLCRGSQVLNVVFGGTLYQDIYAQSDGPLLQHRQKAPRHYGIHGVTLEASSKLREIVGRDAIRVNSFHHQAVRRPGEGLLVNATASDGVVEGVESEKHSFVIGVQWHPEHMAPEGDDASDRLFRAFVSASGRRRDGSGTVSAAAF